ncbi:MAG: NAD(P)-binding protein [Archaeoglobaceae archaeon]|nr:NAD(P)-binding protein [Archaeoglobaceae archaeon]
MICIVGGGLSGLSVGHFLKNRCVVFESTRIGGLLRSEKIDGFTFDTGGSHILFSRDEYVLKEMLQFFGDYVEHRRRAFILYRDKLVKYPFENGIFSLPVQERFEILKDFVENLTREKKKPENLLEWFRYVFGNAITEKYLRPYNEKLWKRDLRDISLEWVGGRIPNPPVDDVLRSAVGLETEGYTHQLRFFYPLNGGIETLARNIAKNVNVRMEAVKKIDIGEKIYVNGEYEFKKMIYTAPLKDLPNLLHEAKEIKDFIDSLEYNSLSVFGIGVKGKVPNIHWIYVPQEDIVFHRVAFLSNYSPNMSPKNCSTIIAEISNQEKVKEEEVVEGLRKIGIENEIEVVEKWNWKFAYIVYNHDYRKNIDVIKKFLIERRIVPFGRFGSWEYLNMDSIWKKAKEISYEFL